MNEFEINLKHKLETLDELSLIYTPGVGFSSKEIARNQKTRSRGPKEKANKRVKND